MSHNRLESLRSDMKKCVRCSLCKLVPMPTIQQNRFTSACPPVDEYHFHAYSGGGMQVMALAYLDGRIPLDGELARIVSACTACGMCDVSCKFIMAAERQEVILALKEAVADAGLAPVPVREAPPALPDWTQGLDLKTAHRASAPVLLLPGAGVTSDRRHAATARRLVRLLQQARVDFCVLEEPEADSGIEAYWTGHRMLFEEQARRLTERLDASGARTILTLCGEDLGMLRSKFARAGCAPRAEVLHASEFLLPLLRRGRLKLKQPVPLRVTYHDPCYLGRQSEVPLAWNGEERQTHGVMTYFVPPKPIAYGVQGVFEAPRRVLGMIPGLQFVEMHRIREYAYCCGGGGGVPQAHPNVARSAARQRLEEARSIGAELLVTACQHCRQNLDGSREATSLPVMDLVDLVYEAAGLGGRDD